MQKNIMNDLYKTIVKLEQYISKIILFFIIGLTFIAAMSRAFNFPLPWSIDVILLLFCWFAFFAASQATRRKANLGVDIIVRHLPKTVQNIIDLINKLLITFFFDMHGIQFTQIIHNKRKKTDNIFRYQLFFYYCLFICWMCAYDYFGNYSNCRTDSNNARKS